MADKNTIHVDIVSAEGEIFSGEAEMFFAPGADGDLGIAPRHAPLLTLLKPGEVRVKTPDGQEFRVELVIIESPFRALIGPLMRYIDAVERRHPEGTAVVTILLPEYMPAHWWEFFLHTHTALQLKGALLFRRRTAVASVPYHLHA